MKRLAGLLLLGAAGSWKVGLTVVGGHWLHEVSQKTPLAWGINVQFWQTDRLAADLQAFWLPVRTPLATHNVYFTYGRLRYALSERSVRPFVSVGAGFLKPDASIPEVELREQEASFLVTLGLQYRAPEWFPALLEVGYARTFARPATELWVFLYTLYIP